MPTEALAAIFIYFLVGVVLRQVGLATQDNAAFVFRLVFYVTLPALAFGAISDSSLTAASVALPLTGFLVNVIVVAIALVYARRARLDRQRTGTLALNTGIANSIFTLPFVLAVLGPAALADAVLYDLGNAIFVATVAYGLAARYGDSQGASVLSSVTTVLRSPLFVAVFAAIVVSVAKLEVPAFVDTLIGPLGAATTPLVLLALGASFSSERFRESPVLAAVMIRMAGGLVAGLILIVLFSLEGVTALVVLACAAAPVGFNSVTLASIGKLDVELATAALAASVVIGLITTTTLLLLGSQLLPAGL